VKEEAGEKKEVEEEVEHISKLFLRI